MLGLRSRRRAVAAALAAVLASVVSGAEVARGG